jgi:hypothetical protein
MLRSRPPVKCATEGLLTTHLAALLIILTAYQAMSADPSTLPGASFPRAGVSGVLKDRPFHATFEITGVQPPPDDPPWVSEVFRNRAGSVRTEMSGHHFAWIMDTMTQRLIVLDHASKLAVVSPVKIPESAESAPRWGFNKFPAFTDESASILGVLCKKVMLSNGKTQSSAAGEVWIAYDLGIVMQDSKPQANGSTIWRAVSIDQSEPAASVFEIPGGYKIAGS